MDKKTIQIAKQYDQASEAFLRWKPSAPFTEIFERVMAKILDTLPPGNPPFHLLEVGCGHGTWIQQMADAAQRRGRIVTLEGIDPSGVRIQKAKERLTDYTNITLRCESFEDTACNVSYHGIFFIEVLQYFDAGTYSSVLDKCHHLLKEGGFLIIIDKEKFSRHSLSIQIRKIRGLMPAVYEHVHYPSFGKLVRLARQHEKWSLLSREKVKEFHSLILQKET